MSLAHHDGLPEIRRVMATRIPVRLISHIYALVYALVVGQCVCVCVRVRALAREAQVTDVIAARIRERSHVRKVR